MGRQITKIFKNTQRRVAFRMKNTINNSERGWSKRCLHRAEPSRAAPRWLLHSVAVNTSRQHCHGDDSTSPSYCVTVHCWAIVQ
jgi:hypothetical protein